MKGSRAQKQRPYELLWTLWFDEKSISNIHECDVQQSHHVWDKRKLHGLEIALMIIFTVAETSSFVGMTKGFAAAAEVAF